MADQSIVHIGENSPEQVAYKLLRHIAQVEGFTLDSNMGTKASASPEWILRTYADCIATVRSGVAYKDGSPL